MGRLQQSVTQLRLMQRLMIEQLHCQAVAARIPVGQYVVGRFEAGQWRELARVAGKQRAKQYYRPGMYMLRRGTVLS